MLTLPSTHDHADHMTGMIAQSSASSCSAADAPAEMRCQYPSKRCDNLRTTKRGGGLHRLCSFHRARANKNQWLVDQRRRMRREREGSLMRRSPTSVAAHGPADLHVAAPFALDVFDVDAVCPPLGDEDLLILQALLFNEEDGELSDISDLDFSEETMTDASMEWLV